MESADEDDAAILLQTEFVWALGVVLDVSPLSLIHFSLVEELVITSDSNLRLAFLILGGEEATGICWKIRAFVVPILQAPGVDREILRRSKDRKGGSLAAKALLARLLLGAGFEVADQTLDLLYILRYIRDGFSHGCRVNVPVQEEGRYYGWYGCG